MDLSLSGGGGGGSSEPREPPLVTALKQTVIVNLLVHSIYSGLFVRSTEPFLHIHSGCFG